MSNHITPLPKALLFLFLWVKTRYTGSPAPHSHLSDLIFLQPPWQPYCSSNSAGTLLPQGLCTGSSPCLHDLSPDICRVAPHLLQISSAQWGPLWPLNLNQNLHTHISSPFPVQLFLPRPPSHSKYHFLTHYTIYLLITVFVYRLSPSTRMPGSWG